MGRDIREYNLKSNPIRGLGFSGNTRESYNIFKWDYQVKPPKNWWAIMGGRKPPD